MKQTLSGYLKTIKTNERVKLPELDVADVGYWAQQVLEQYSTYTMEQKLQIKESADAYRKWKINN
jgi:hypothetical protein